MLGFGLAIVGVQGQNLFDRLSTGNPSVPGSQSATANDILQRADTRGPSLTLVLHHVDPSTTGLPEALLPARAALSAIKGVASVTDPLALPGGVANPAAAPLLAQDKQGFLIVVQLAPGLSASDQATALGAVEQQLKRVPSGLRAVAPDATGQVGGRSLIVDAITSQVEQDLRTGEAIALPVALVIMILVFGGFLAASMPMLGYQHSRARGRTCAGRRSQRG